MEPIKFEESIKEKLEKRTLLPSAGTWDILLQRLDAERKKNNNKPFWWFGLAASIVGILFIVTMFFNNKAVENNTPVIVDGPISTQQENIQVAIEKSTTNNSGLEASESTQKVNSDRVFVKPKLIENKMDVIQEVLIPTKNETINPIEVKQQTLTFEEQKIQEVAAKINGLKEDNKVVTNSEIETLIQKAQKEIALKQLYNESTGVVDARLLLQDVETDLEKSFRDKVFETLKANYNFVKTAVVQRND